MDNERVIKMKVRYIGEDHIALKKGKIYYVLDVKHGTYKIMTELDETYYIPKSVLEIIDEDLEEE